MTVPPTKAHALHSAACALEKATRAYKRWTAEPSPELRAIAEHRVRIYERYRRALTR